MKTIKYVSITLIVINALLFSVGTKSLSFNNLYELKNAAAWGGETPNVTYSFTSDNPQSCTNCCPKEHYQSTEMAWVGYNGSVKVGGVIHVEGVPLTIEINSSGEKGYNKVVTVTGDSDGSGIKHIYNTFSWTSSCKAGIACPSRIAYI